MLEVILTIATIIGGLAAIDYFWGKWYTAKVVRGILAKFRTKPFFLEEPEKSQLPLDSPLYIERSPIESDCYETIVQSNALIRIEAPPQMGKTSLMTRILHHANQQGCRKAHLYFQEAEEQVFSELDSFLRWFCTKVTSELSLPNKLDKLDEFWNETPGGSKDKCKSYFQRHLLSASHEPVVLGLDGVEHVFQYLDIAKEFFGLLRAWHEQGKYEAVWKKLRLVIVHPKDIDIPLDVTQSPFNVGIVVKLPAFNRLQVQELARRHALNWSNEQVEKLMAMVGGHPYLVGIALYQIAKKRMTLEKLLQVAPTESGPYSTYLRHYLLKLKENAALAKAFKPVITANKPIPLDEIEEALKLRSMGLVKFQEDDTMIPLCDLYRLYFSNRLKT